jgi:hypothetical protein
MSPISTAEGADCNSEIIYLLKSGKYATGTDYKNNSPPTQGTVCEKLTCTA